MRKKALTADDVRALLGKEVTRKGSQQAWAEWAGVSGAYVHDVMHGRREPGESILKALGLKKVVIYTRDQWPTNPLSSPSTSRRPPARRSLRGTCAG
jgi:hypothetical protein